MLMKKLYIEGYIPVGEYSRLVKNNNEIYVEKIKKSAFAKSLMFKDNVKLLWNHNKEIVLDKVEDTLKLIENNRGLIFSAIIGNQEFIKLILNKKINISFSFICYKDKKFNKNNVNVRNVELLRLNEITLTTNKTFYKGSITKIDLIEN
jgi:HK97 family phage prohead protease